MCPFTACASNYESVLREREHREERHSHIRFHDLSIYHQPNRRAYALVFSAPSV